jgi:hypothetical protein
MFTDSSQHRHNADLKPVGLFARAAGRVQQFVCGLHGHDALLHFDHGRMSLLCTSCGYESPGWDIKEASGTARERGDTGRMRTLPLVRARRVA